MSGCVVSDIQTLAKLLCIYYPSYKSDTIRGSRLTQDLCLRNVLRDPIESRIFLNKRCIQDVIICIYFAVVKYNRQI
jgi:hypothetical protein